VSRQGEGAGGVTEDKEATKVRGGVGLHRQGVERLPSPQSRRLKSLA
jgi:hypothetical protein